LRTSILKPPNIKVVKYQNKHPKIVKSSRDLTMSLGKMSFSKEKSVSESLEISLENTFLSLWKMYEVNISLYCFTSFGTNIFNIKSYLRLIKNNILQKKSVIKNRLFSISKNELKTQSPPYILFLGFPEYLAKENFPLIFEKIIQDKKYNLLTIVDQSTGPRLIDNLMLNINSIDCNHFRFREAIFHKQVRNKIKEVKLNIKDSKLDNTYKKNILKALNFIRPIAENFTPKYLALAEHLLLNNPPVVIVSLDAANPHARVFTLMANKLGIPVVQIQAGPITQECIEWSFCEDDLVLTHGPKVESELKELMFAGKAVNNVGSAKFENIRRSQSEIENSKDNWNWAKKFNLPKKRVRILFLTSYNLFHTSQEFKDQNPIYEDMYLSVISEVSKCNEISLIIKPHPLDKSSSHKNLSSKYQNIFAVASNEDTLELIKWSDVVISFGSTASIDAIICNKPVIVLQFYGFNMISYYENADFCLTPKNGLELRRIISQLANGELNNIIEELKQGRARFLKSINYFNESPSRIIVDKIYNLIDQFRDSKRPLS
jgi:hypothetical protein